MRELPPVVKRYLENHHLVAVDVAELEALRDPPKRWPERNECPYPLFEHKFGPTHAEYVGTLFGKDGTLDGLHVVQCSACGNVSFETPVALA